MSLLSTPDRQVRFLVGNTYRRIPEQDAAWDRTGRHRKLHDWTLYVDIVQGNADVVDKVLFDLGSSFEPSVYCCASPVPAHAPVLRRPDGRPVMRFCTRQQSYGVVKANIRLRGVGGSSKTVTHRIGLHPEGAANHSSSSSSDQSSVLTGCHTFEERRPLRPLRMLKFPETQNFGIELELTSAVSLTQHEIARRLNGLHGSQYACQVAGSYAEGRQPGHHGWKIVPDSSIVCSVSLPDCNKFELVSPILTGHSGLNDVHNILRAMMLYTEEQGTIKVNRTMGFHVHVDVSSLGVAELIKICLNFIKYEDAMDSLMPKSRRTGSVESNQYFQSNRQAVPGGNNKSRHANLAACRTLEQLCRTMNSNSSRYFKLNLQNLASGRQPTLEFRQHSATASYEKVAAWVRLCVAFCYNSARLAPPKPLKDSRSVDDQFDALFYYVIKDRALCQYYRDRRNQVDSEGGDCCAECQAGRGCRTSVKRVRR